MNTTAIAQHLNIAAEAILKIEEWATVLWVRFKGGCRFVSKKVVKMSAQITRKTWEYGDNYQLSINGKVVESWSTKDFTLNGFIVVFAKKHGLNRDEIELGEGVDDIPKSTTPNHQQILSEVPYVPVYDPRIESNDFDNDEIYC